MRNWQDIRAVEPGPESNPFWYMTLEEARVAFDQLVAEGLRLPHGVFPGSRPGAIVEAVITSWSQWKRYQWNPPEFLVIADDDFAYLGVPDPEASDKPTWQTLVAAKDRGLLMNGRRDAITGIRKEARRRTDLVRSAERDRLIGVCEALEAGVPAMELDALQSFDPTQDFHWVEEESE